jgi:uncharacterized membrane-anchored protein
MAHKGWFLPLFCPTVNLVRQLARKVPEITIFFWIVKLLTTAMGEATSDYLVHRFNPILAVACGAIGFVIALLWQLSARRYIAGLYWFAVVMVAVFGTMAADVLHVRFGVSYAVLAALYGTILFVVFVTWHRVEKTLSIHSIDTRRRELFYWATVFATFAFGTATGDMTATTFHFGYLSSAILFAGIIVIPAIGYWRFGLNEVAAFWIAYVVTRPLGASLADWMGFPHSVGGLNWGHGTVALVTTAMIAGFVVYLSVSRVDVKRPGTAQSANVASLSVRQADTESA